MRTRAECLLHYLLPIRRHRHQDRLGMIEALVDKGSNTGPVLPVASIKQDEVTNIKVTHLAAAHRGTSYHPDLAVRM